MKFGYIRKTYRSHVVIRSLEPAEETLLEAAKIAAYYSKAKESSSVPVDFTKIRHVKNRVVQNLVLLLMTINKLYM